MTQAIVKKTISKTHLDCDLQALAQDQAPEVIQSQVLVNMVGVNLIESRSPEKNLKELIKKSKLNAKYLEKLVSANNYKGMLDAKLLGVRNSMINF
jgi:hypothetical protein